MRIIAACIVKSIHGNLTQEDIRCLERESRPLLYLLSRRAEYLY